MWLELRTVSKRRCAALPGRGAGRRSNLGRSIVGWLVGPWKARWVRGLSGGHGRALPEVPVARHWEGADGAALKTTRDFGLAVQALLVKSVAQ